MSGVGRRSRGWSWNRVSECGVVGGERVRGCLCQCDHPQRLVCSIVCVCLGVSGNVSGCVELLKMCPSGTVRTSVGLCTCETVCVSVSVVSVPWGCICACGSDCIPMGLYVCPCGGEGLWAEFTNRAGVSGRRPTPVHSDREVVVLLRRSQPPVCRESSKLSLISSQKPPLFFFGCVPPPAPFLGWGWDLRKGHLAT